MKALTTLLLIATSTIGLSAMTKFSQTTVSFKEPIIRTHGDPPLPDPKTPKPPSRGDDSSFSLS